jgi:hypothetical protein
LVVSSQTEHRCRQGFAKFGKLPRARLKTESVRFMFGNMISAAPLQACFRFLRRLRADGRTNMYGAVPYLMKTFHLDREAAFAIVCQWLDQQDHSEPERTAPPRRLVRKSG